MAGIAVAEAKEKRAPKTLDHLEIHARLGGGNIVRHVYKDYHHEPMDVNFDEDGRREGKGSGHGEHIMAHLQKHAVIPAMTSADGGAGDETEDE